MISALAIDSNPSSDVRRTPLSQKVEVGINSLVFATVGLIALVSFVYLAHSNQNATKGYALKNLEYQRTQLITENEVWDMEISKVKSLEALQSDPAIQGMVAAEQPKFVRGDTAIAAQ